MWVDERNLRKTSVQSGRTSFPQGNGTDLRLFLHLTALLPLSQLSPQGLLFDGCCFGPFSSWHTHTLSQQVRCSHQVGTPCSLCCSACCHFLCLLSFLGVCVCVYAHCWLEGAMLARLGSSKARFLIVHLCPTAGAVQHGEHISQPGAGSLQLF